ncbi:hypothetical protein BANT10_03453 [Brevibacterium antiquum]|uniref:Uncharacterized protein n=1 Tax=Brevibacterium antiquum TaxID=234835 RepID=A0A2H1KSW7_9MICO|nr:hypothetical protein BANT10_03453 [Brevibacterium antiquum]
MLKGDSTRLMGAKHLVLAVAVVALGVLGVAAPASASASPAAVWFCETGFKEHSQT